MKYIKWILLGMAVIVVTPMILDTVIFGNSIQSNLSNAEWSAFLGSYIGAIIGGIVSLIGIVLTIQFTQRENEKTRDFEKKTEEKAQEKELHLMVAELSEDIISCGEALLRDVEEPICSNMVFENIYQVQPAMLKKARKLKNYANIRAAATNRPQLDFSQTFEKIKGYAKALIDICEWIVRQKCHRPCEEEQVRNQVQKNLIEIREKAEQELLEYAKQIVRDSDNK